MAKFEESTKETTIDFGLGQPEREKVKVTCPTCKKEQVQEINPEAKRAQFYKCLFCGSVEKYYKPEA
jgi:transposase-like protein